MKKGIIYTMIFTLLISFFFVFLLSSANELTKGITERNEKLSLRKAVLKAFRFSFRSDKEAFALYDEKITVVNKDNTGLFMCEMDGVPVYGILFQGNGLWGPISGILAVNKDVTMIIGIEFLSHNETPGLGGRIDEDAYKNQLRLEVVGPGGMIKGTRKGAYDLDHKNGVIDGISGATRTSESVERIVNTELARLRTLLEVK